MSLAEHDEPPLPEAEEWPRPVAPRVPVRSMISLHRFLEPNRFWYAVSVALESNRRLYGAFTWLEQKIKGGLFGCRMCAQCTLPATAYACPQTCPKQLRNGPCGGVTADGRCEVYPELPCVWATAYARAESAGREGDFRRLVRPIDHRKWGQSSWVNYWRGRDDDLWTAEGETEGDYLPLLSVRAPVA